MIRILLEQCKNIEEALIVTIQATSMKEKNKKNIQGLSILGEDAELFTISFKDYLDEALSLPKRLKGWIDLNNKDGMD
ncbi:hypothetical protein [Lysinibacillus sp. NPDC096259]|uniref:hypothetical protein n=1 Tax=Lysinibacillus sp. NPDC096259 TaxID=3390583 RepID=UPI003CFF3DE7